MWKIALGTAVVLLVLSWLNGREVRSRWETRPTLVIHPYTGPAGAKKTLVVMWTGAFNNASIVFERLIELYQQVGDVCVVVYADERFVTDDVVTVPYEFAREHQYEEILCEGESLGAGLALRFIQHVRLNAAEYAPTLVGKILRDMPHGKQHLLPGLVDKYPLVRRFLLWLVKYIHIGPVLNMLSPKIMGGFFQKVPMSKTNGVDMDQWRRHMIAMWNLRLSVLIEQVAAIVRMKLFTHVTGEPTVYLRSTSDEVILAQEARDDTHALFGLTLLGDDIPVPGDHAMSVENHDDCRPAHVEALTRLGYAVV